MRGRVRCMLWRVLDGSGAGAIDADEDQHQDDSANGAPLTPGASGGAGPFSHRPRHNHAISAARLLLAGRPFGGRIAVMLRKVLKIAAAA